MISLYLFCFIPAAIWLVLFFLNKEIHAIEAVASLSVAFLIAGITHICSYKSQTGDYEYWSGQIVGAKFFEDWTEKYEEPIYRDESYTVSVPDGKGGTKTETRTRRVFSHYEWRTEYHEEYAVAYSNIDTSYRISKSKYLEFLKDFGGEKKVKGDRSTSNRSSHSIKGDDYDYVTVNSNNPVIPVTKRVAFENRLKAGSVWDKVPPPAELNIPDRPENDNPWRSNRLLGIAKNDFSILELDKLNAVLGPTKKIDINIVGFDSDNSMMGQHVESKWKGGNKNSLTIVYCRKESKRPNMVHCFGWSKSDICKENIEHILMNNDLGDDVVPLIQEEIQKNYTKPDFKEYDYIQIQPGGWAWFWFLTLVILSQGVIIWISLRNSLNK